MIRVPGDPAPADPPVVVATIGNFDGVHRGHRYLLEHVRRRAAERGIASAVITFDPHPRQVLRPEAPLPLLSTLADRIDLFGQLGIDWIVVVRFDEALRQLTAEQFLARVGRYVSIRHLVHGPGFALGRGREGTPAVLAALGRRLGFTVEEIAPLSGDGVAPAGSSGTPDAAPLSSSAIRMLVEAGEVERAAAALSRPPALTGVVVEGERLGRTLGFPTANLRLDGPAAIPADGVYAAWAERWPHTPGAERLPAAVSVGTRPTFGGTRRVVEAYLLDFSGDLYGETIRLHFIRRLRGQKRFDAIEPLVAQMRRDVAETRRILGVAVPTPSPIEASRNR